MLAQELMHINVVKGIKDTIGAKTFMGRASIPIRPFADRPGEPVTDWYDMGKGEWSNDDGTVSHPWHAARLLHRGGPLSGSVQCAGCRLPCAFVHCKLLSCIAAQHAPDLCAADEHWHHVSSLSVRCSLWQTAQLVPVTICSAQIVRGSSYTVILWSVRCVQVSEESMSQPTDSTLILKLLHSIKAKAFREISWPAS